MALTEPIRGCSGGRTHGCYDIDRFSVPRKTSQKRVVGKMKRAAVWGAGCAFAIVAAQGLSATGVSISFDGQPMTSKAIIRNGVLFIPAEDVARATGRNLKAEVPGKSYSFMPSGGANAAEGASGKAGDVLFNGTTRLTVISPMIEGDRLILNMEVRNAEKKTKTYYVTLSESKYPLFDSQGNSLEPMSVSESFPELEPGSMKKFVVKYDISKGFKPERMVVTLHTHVPGNSPKKETFRIKF
jgi:hypothetical protein